MARPLPRTYEAEASVKNPEEAKQHSFGTGGPVGDLQSGLARRLSIEVAPTAFKDDLAARISRLMGPLLFCAAWGATIWFGFG